nr:hypothetical protein [Tanacetum cinerariifolium]
MVPFIKDLWYTGKCDTISEIHTDQMHQPWRRFLVVINRCISGKSTCVDKLMTLRAQILWGMFYKKDVDFVALPWEDFMFQEDNRDISLTRKENMPYLRYTKVIINHFISKDKTISMRNMINLITIQNDSLLEYKIYLSFATGEATPKKARNFKKIASPSKKQTLVLEKEHVKKPKHAKHPEPAKKFEPAKKNVSSKKPSRKQSTGVQIKDTPDVSVSKKKAPTTTNRSKGIDLLFEATLLEDAQIKKVLERSKRETHFHQASGSGDGVDSQPKAPDELQDNTIGKNEGTGTKPGVPDVPKDQSESENESWGESGDDDDNDDDSNDDDSDDDSYNDAVMMKGLSLMTIRTMMIKKKIMKMMHGKEGKGNVEITDVGHDDVTQEETYDQVEDDAHVTLTTAHVTQKTKVPLQSSSVSSDFASQFLNLDTVVTTVI